MQQLAPTKREGIEALQREMLKHDQVGIPVTHYVPEGLYAREMKVAAGVTIVGKVHKKEHLCVITKGKARVVSDELTEIVEAPYIYVSKAGAKRAIHVLEDLHWLTVHPMPDSGVLELADMEEQLVETDPVPAVTHENRSEVELDQDDYLRFLDERALTEQDVQDFMAEDETIAPLDMNYLGLKVRVSERQGLGVFALEGFSEDYLVCAMKVGNVRTPPGRYMNHSVVPNCKVTAGGYILHTLRPIEEGEEMTVNYRDVLMEVSS